MRILFFLLFVIPVTLMGQETFPNAKIKNMAGAEITARQLISTQSPTVISFWATWCKPCLQELDAFSELASTWEKETHAKVIAIAIDDSRTAAAIKKTMGLHDWSFDVYWDENQELKRSLNITAIPHTLVIDTNGKIIKRYSAYVPGNEEQILSLLKTLENK